MILWIPTTDFFFQFDYIKGFIINKFSLNRPLMKFHLRNLSESRILVIHTCRALTLMISIDSAVVYFSPSVHTSGIKWNWVRVYRHWIITFKKLLLNKFIHLFIYLFIYWKSLCSVFQIRWIISDHKILSHYYQPHHIF